MKILIADDMKVARIVLEMALRKLAHDVAVTSDGEEAWQAFQDGDFPVLITDWQMPKVSGLELCRLIRTESRPRYTYILMLTSLDTKPDYMTAIEAGTDDFLIKPVDEGMLAARLHVAERISGLLSELQMVKGQLPICPTCKKIRDENEQWTQVELFVSAHLHSVVVQRQCPQCELTRNCQRNKMAQVVHDLRKTT